MSPRTLVSALTCLGVAAVGLAATSVPTATAESPSARAGADAVLQLYAPDEIEAFSDRGRVWADLGVRLVSPRSDVEVWSHRTSYDQPIVSEVRTPSGTTTLPPGAMKDFTGIDGLVVLDVRRAGTSKKLVHRELDACLSSTGERVQPDAAPTSRYPRWCPYNPYTVGSVMGIQEGWASNVFESSGVRPFHLPTGTYVVETRVAKRYWPAFGLTEQTASATTRMTVTDECPECGGRFPGAHASHRPAHRPIHRPGDGPDPAPGPRPVAATNGRVAGPVPDLRSLPAFGIGLNGKGTALRFSATVWNAGDSPLVIDGFRRPSGEVMDAYQYFFDTDGHQTGYQQVGTMEFHHANHNHWHFEDFARYDLLDADKAYVKKSRKQSFCLANTDAVDYTVPGADWQPENTDLATACGSEGALSIREVLAAGSGDTYAQYRAGQAFRIEDLPNGIYYIRVEGNPERNLTESDTTNNVADRRIRIGGRGAGRWVKVAPLGDVVEPEGY